MTSRIRDWISKSLVTLGSVFAVAVLVGLVLIPPMRAQQQAADPQGAQKQTCLNNEKQLSLTLLQYVSDYDEKFPCGTQSAPDGSHSGVGWAGESYYNERTSAPYHCPTDPTQALRPQFAVSYGMNAHVANQSFATFNNPASTILLFETGGDPVFLRLADEGASQGATVFSASGDGTDGTLRAGPQASLAPGVVYACGYLGGRVPSNPPGQFSRATGRHTDQPIFAYTDGHVTVRFPGMISSGANAPNSTAPQTGGATGTAAGTNVGGYSGTFSTQ